MRFLLTLGVVALLVGCGTDVHDHSTEETTAEAELPAAVYSVRGVIADLPPEGEPRDKQNRYSNPKSI